MSRIARRTLPALLVVLVLGIVPVPAAQALSISHRSSTNIYGPIDLSGFLRHLWTSLSTIFGRDGAGTDPNGKPGPGH